MGFHGVFTTDDNGQFSATLKKGPQETKVVIDGQESTVMYVDNIAGMLDTTLTMEVTNKNPAAA